MQAHISMALRLAGVLAAVPLWAGCEAATDAAPEESASPPGANASRTEGVALRGAPEPGTCHRVPPQVPADADYWFDDSPEVPCTRRHTTETVGVYPLTEPTVEEATKVAGRCWDKVRLYVNVDLDDWVPWMPVLYLPSQDQVADGASFTRCDVAVPADWRATPAAAWLTDSVAEMATTRAAEFLPCLDRDPKRDQPFVPCDEPHQYEATGQLAHIADLAEYPSPTTLRAEADQCLHGLPRRLATPAYTVTASWDSGIDPLGDVAGVCFVYRRDGEALPARR